MRPIILFSILLTVLFYPTNTRAQTVEEVEKLLKLIEKVQFSLSNLGIQGYCPNPSFEETIRYASMIANIKNISENPLSQCPEAQNEIEIFIHKAEKEKAKYKRLFLAKNIPNFSDKLNENQLILNQLSNLSETELVKKMN